MNYTFKPERLPYMVTKMTASTFLLFILHLSASIATYFLFDRNIFLASLMLVGFVLTFSLMYYLYLVVYNKLEYSYYPDKIVQKGGTIFSDYETELKIKNITHIKKRLPFVENKLFQTGHIDIESAGAASSEIHVCSIKDYDDKYKGVIDLLGANGFNEEKGELKTIEKPNSLGVFFEVFKGFIYSILGATYIVYSIVYDDDGERNETAYEFVVTYFLPLVNLVLLVLFVFFIFRFLDLKKRMYEIYENAITYSEGFLSKNYSYLPFENLSDSSVTQTLVDKMFSLYDVKLSCQGSSQEILFKNMANGVAMSEQLEKLIEQKSIVKHDSTNSGLSIEDEDSAKIHKQIVSNVSKIEMNLDLDNEYEDEFKMDVRRTVKLPLYALGVSVVLAIFSILLIIVIPDKFENPVIAILMALGVLIFIVSGILSLVSLVVFIFSYISYKFTTYRVKKNSVNRYYSFLTTKETEFNAEKVTAVVINQGILDFVFDTVSISFWSIGASSKLGFSYVKKDDQQKERILSKFGIRHDDELYRIDPDFEIIEWFRQSIFGFILALVVSVPLFIGLAILNIVAVWILLVLVLIAFLVIVFYKKGYFKRTYMIFFKNYVYYQKGWIYKSSYYVKYGDIKDTVRVKYPLSKEGSIRFNVAGEQVSRNQKNSPVSSSSNMFVIDFVEDVLKVAPFVAKLIAKEERAQNDLSGEEELKSVKPSLKNVMFPVLLAMTILNIPMLLLALLAPSAIKVPLLILIFFVDAFVCLLFYLPVKMTTYIMGSTKLIERSGVFYKRQLMIDYDKIDFINNNQGPLNKIFGNGSIQVNTVGSSKTELNIKNIPGFMQFYNDLKRKYE